ncbi:LOW QUALITY PROTEIN: hypothetical protein PanWU01x14_053650 [Parasponia andersonii]|uniref:Uncharacterized protein n=1 Tax=Parasponia andersonii TaxID=3476 RepID=A0A2P5DLL2_PARAD|nr:LOW QUALITY PROTEIN: hypothetical protein PanWU01x14_053650 [Parasponia andersonii]
MQKPRNGFWFKHWNRRGYSLTLNDQEKASWVLNMMCQMVSKNVQSISVKECEYGFSKEIVPSHSWFIYPPPIVPYAISCNVTISSLFPSGFSVFLLCPLMNSNLHPKKIK